MKPDENGRYAIDWEELDCVEIVLESELRAKTRGEIDSFYKDNPEADANAYFQASLQWDIDNWGDAHESFFSSIGQIAHGVAKIENKICKFLIQTEDDKHDLNEKIQGKNLANLLPIFAAEFLEKYGANPQLRNWLYVIKKILIDIDRFRNIAVYCNWAYLNGPIYKPSYKSSEDSEDFIIVSPAVMKKRAFACLEAYNLLCDLFRAAEGKEDYSCNITDEKGIERHYFPLKEAKKYLNKVVESLK